MIFRAGQGLAEKERNTFTHILSPSSGYLKQGHGWGDPDSARNERGDKKGEGQGGKGKDKGR